MNTRREKFKNPTLREALIHAFDFEWTNKTIMYGAYKRTFSVFQNSNMTAEGKPERGRARAARAVPRQGAGRGVRRAVHAAGLGRIGAGPRAAAQGVATAAAGRLPDQGRQARRRQGRAGHDRVPDRRADVPAAPHAVHQEPRRLLGIDATLRMVDPVQFRKRVDEFDFDITVQRFNFSTTPGDSLRNYFSLPVREDERLVQSRRHRRSGDRRADREDHRGRDAAASSPPPAARSTA